MTNTRNRFGRAVVAKLSDERERFHQLVERSRADSATSAAPVREPQLATSEPSEAPRG